MSGPNDWSLFRLQVPGFSTRTVFRTTSGQNWTAEDVMSYYTSGVNRHVPVATTVEVGGQQRWAPISLDRTYVMTQGIGQSITPRDFAIVNDIMEGRVPFNPGETLEVVAARALTMNLRNPDGLQGDRASFSPNHLRADNAETFVFGSTAFRIYGRVVRDENGDP
jgi:hypothetical protein